MIRTVPSELSRTVAILGMGCAVPEHSIHQQDAALMAQSVCGYSDENARRLSGLYERTQVDRRAFVLLDSQTEDARPATTFLNPTQEGNEQGPDTGRRMQLYETEAPGLALGSSKKALAQAEIPASRIGHLVTASCTGFSAPGFDIHLIRELGLSPGVSRTHVGFMGCHGLFNAFRAAAALAREDPEKAVLVCSVEICSVHFAYGWDPGRVISNALFADGAAAAVCQVTPPEGKKGWQLAASASRLFPDSADAMTWKIGNHGFEMSLSPKIPSLIAAHVRSWLSLWLAESGLALGDIRSWAIHPGGPRILEAVTSALDLPESAAEVSWKILASNGNMSSATILFILEELAKEKAPAPCVALGFGPGLAAEAALFL